MIWLGCQLLDACVVLLVACPLNVEFLVLGRCTLVLRWEPCGKRIWDFEVLGVLVDLLAHPQGAISSFFFCGQVTVRAVSVGFTSRRVCRVWSLEEQASHYKKTQVTERPGLVAATGLPTPKLWTRLSLLGFSETRAEHISKGDCDRLWGWLKGCGNLSRLYSRRR